MRESVCPERAASIARQKLAALGITLLTGCAGALTPAQEARLERFECQVHAVEPLVSPVFDAAQLLRDVKLGKATMAEALQTLGATTAEIDALMSRLRQCGPGSGPEPAPVQGSAPEELAS